MSMMPETEDLATVRKEQMAAPRALSQRKMGECPGQCWVAIGLGTKPPALHFSAFSGEKDATDSMGREFYSGRDGHASSTAGYLGTGRNLSRFRVVMDFSLN